MKSVSKKITKVKEVVGMHGFFEDEMHEDEDEEIIIKI